MTFDIYNLYNPNFFMIVIYIKEALLIGIWWVQNDMHLVFFWVFGS